MHPKLSPRHLRTRRTSKSSGGSRGTMLISEDVMFTCLDTKVNKGPERWEGHHRRRVE